MFAYTAVARLLIYPTALAASCGRDLLFPALIDFLIEGIIVWALAFLCSRTDKTFFGLLEATFGNIFARIIYGLFAAFFILFSIIPIFEQKLYVHAIFYDTVPSLIVFLPIFIFSLYAACKKFENIGRCADICMPIFIFAMAFIFAMSYNEVKLGNLMPVLQTPINNLLSEIYRSFYRFIEPCWLLMFMGHFKYKKGDAAKITLSFAGAAVVVLLFLAVFYGIYGGLSASRTFAISRTSLFFGAIDTIGRIDLIILYVLETVMLFSLVLNIQLAVHCISECSGYGERRVISLAVNVALALVLIFCDHKFYSMQMFYYEWMWIPAVIFAVLMPVLAWTLKRRKQ